MRLLLLALACAVCLVACGGGDDEEPVPAGSGSGDATEESSSGGGSEDWTAQVNAVCRRNQRETQKIAAEAQEEGGATDEELTATVIERSVPLQEQLLAELDDVEPPEDVADDYDSFLDRIGDGVDLFPRLAGSVRSGKEDQELAEEFGKIADETRPFAQEHGLDACIPDAG
jgi:hypothetical protein